MSIQGLSNYVRIDRGWCCTSKQTKVVQIEATAVSDDLQRIANIKRRCCYSPYDQATKTKIARYEKGINQAKAAGKLKDWEVTMLDQSLTAAKEAGQPLYSWKKTLGVGLLLLMSGLVGSATVSSSLRQDPVGRGICPRNVPDPIGNFSRTPDVNPFSVGWNEWFVNRAQDIYYEIELPSKPDAKAIEQKGLKALEEWKMMSLASIPLAAENSKADAAFIEKGRSHPVLPAKELRDYIDYAWEKGYMPNLTPEFLQSLLGADRDLSSKETRELYNLIDSEIIPYAVKKMETALQRVASDSPAKVGIEDRIRMAFQGKGSPDEKSCLLVSKIASDIRASARIYTRLRMGNEKGAHILDKRDEAVYGTANPTFAYWVGKHKKANVKETCEKILSKAQQTNQQFNTYAKYF